MLSIFALSALLAASVVPPPVAIDSCRLVRAGSFEHSVHIRFHNTSSRPITSVSFAVRNGPHHVIVQDRGNFSPGTMVDHVLTTPTWELYHGHAQVCSVSSVRFDDGTEWSAAAQK